MPETNIKAEGANQASQAFAEWMNAVSGAFQQVLSGDFVSVESPLEKNSGETGITIRLSSPFIFVVVKMADALNTGLATDGAKARFMEWSDSTDDWIEDPDNSEEESIYPTLGFKGYVFEGEVIKAFYSNEADRYFALDDGHTKMTGELKEDLTAGGKADVELDGDIGGNSNVSVEAQDVTGFPADLPTGTKVQIFWDNINHRWVFDASECV